MLSVANTNVGLTHNAPWNNPGEPGIYYPAGQRNYARVVPTDNAQAAADAIVLHKLGVERAAVLYLGDPLPIVNDFVRAARRLEMTVAGRWGWPEGRASYAQLAARVARAGTDGVFITGGFAPGAVQLLRDLRAHLGREVRFVSDGFDTDTAVLNGASAEGLLISQPGPLGDRLGAAGKRFAATRP
jgi:branched-chain amino acid transport system substrate-binding protein